MESDAERGVGSSEYGGEELSLPLTIAKLNRGMDSIVAKAGTLPTLKNVAGITSFERRRTAPGVRVRGLCGGSWRRTGSRGSSTSSERGR